MLRKFQRVIIRTPLPLRECAVTNLSGPTNGTSYLLHRPQESVDPIFSAKDASARLGISMKTLANWRTSGLYDLKFVKVGSRVFYLSSEIERFVGRRTFGSTSEYGPANRQSININERPSSGQQSGDQP
ncbi:helix-turn-helix domain-containing protein [Mesorhizobium abyssinicae]|uniref:Helix-turn-helix domain-containing protein n=1 Tax=Mesorhizobium abyssinicae TaxID=1209958 RepID=A0ABU5AS32_9HYPH|nr:helix-turn-helix domain-containing protein [Mesorhizobium abyssinicae]MDX8540117.1 helix-turn-helix domain-containing protein [Mesorhizobium abyssinicae]